MSNAADIELPSDVDSDMEMPITSAPKRQASSSSGKATKVIKKRRIAAIPCIAMVLTETLKYMQINIEGLSGDEKNEMLKPSVVFKNEKSKELSLIEVFSVPRVAPVFESVSGLKAASFDLTTGHDMLMNDVRAEVFKTVWTSGVEVTILSPPCCFFSQLMHSNWRRMDKAAREKGLQEGAILLDYAMAVAELQVKNNKGFIFEHPARAGSWKRPSVLNVMMMDNVYQVTFDQCQFGLISAGTSTAMKKPTRLMTNMPTVSHFFGHKLCCGDHKHEAGL